jgi:hypothetical protein
VDDVVGLDVVHLEHGHLQHLEDLTDEPDLLAELVRRGWPLVVRRSASARAKKARYAKECPSRRRTVGAEVLEVGGIREI